ncbi:UDP-N-acetylmuramate dehydrogenase [Candidatus Peribacteria bacterium]|nr:MAG: UDP-N-acetylmuramate dehydrogenase [Candidatus Peribacteria bacterium]
MFQEMISVGGKTTMRIGGQARYYAELATKDDAEAARDFAQAHEVPLIALGGGSNTVFADGVIDALVVRIKNDETKIEGNTVRVGSGKNLPMLINELAKHNLDLSPLTGILGTVGGAVFGNAGQGPGGIWMDTFVKEVLVLEEGEWKIFKKEDCDFGYRESTFKHGPEAGTIIWDVLLEVPSKPMMEIEETIQSLLKRRIETQPHVKTAGSCFKAINNTPAWMLIDAAGLRGYSVGDVQIAEKHANFLLNTGKATFEDAVKLVNNVKGAVSEPLDVEMRFIGNDGSLVF